MRISLATVRRQGDKALAERPLDAPEPHAPNAAALPLLASEVAE
jgi:hypothetical protein